MLPRIDRPALFICGTAGLVAQVCSVCEGDARLGPRPLRGMTEVSVQML